jgi:hypothetical protein
MTDPTIEGSQGLVPPPATAQQWIESEPSVPVSHLPLLTAGLHIMFGPKGSGKTVTARALADYLKGAGCSVSYAYVCEPGAKLSTELFAPSVWKQWFTSCLDAIAQLPKPILILDSMTYTLAMLPEIVALKEYTSQVTYTGGLSPRDILGTLIHDRLCRNAGVAVVATANSDLFPPVEKFEGASEGQLVLRSPGQFSYRNRYARQFSTFNIPQDVVQAALTKVLPGSNALSASNPFQLELPAVERV